MREARVTPALRLSKRELFARLGYAPHRAQVLVHRSTAPRRTVACGSRWGKSTAAAAEVVAALMEPRERSLGWVVAPTYSLTDRVFTLACEHVERCFPHHIAELSSREHRIKVYNLGGGISEARAKSADNPRSLLGEGLDWLVVDEAAHLDHEIWEQHLSQRLIDKQGWALLVSTPRGWNWFHRLFKRGQRTNAEGFDSWAFASWDNPHLDLALIEREIATLPLDACLREYGAIFLRDNHEPCPTCDGPSAAVDNYFILKRGQTLGRCAECDEPVNANGRTVVSLRDGRPDLTIIVESESSAE